MEKSKTTLKNVPIKDLKLYGNNPYRHDKNIDHIENSIKAFGYTKTSIVVDENMELLAGHGTYKALLKLDYKNVPEVSQIKGFTKKQKVAYRIADNESGKGAEIDHEKLFVELDFLEEEFEMEDFGLDIKKTEVLEPMDGEDDVPESAPVVTVKGDLYELGSHRVFCGDSTMIDDVEKLMDNKKGDMVFTDPPYNADYSSRVDKKRRKPWGGILNDKMDEDAFESFLIDLNSSLWASIKENASVYECIDWKRYPQLQKIFNDAFVQKSMIVWNKNYFGLGTYYRTKHELILFGVKGDKLNVWNANHDEMDVWSEDREKVKNYEHPTQKPVTLPERAILNSSNKKNIILDLFLGSGSTLIACEKTKRKCYGMELDEKYCDVIVKRYVDFCDKNDIKHSVKRNGEVCKDFD